MKRWISMEEIEPTSVHDNNNRRKSIKAKPPLYENVDSNVNKCVEAKAF